MTDTADGIDDHLKNYRIVQYSFTDFWTELMSNIRLHSKFSQCENFVFLDKS